MHFPGSLALRCAAIVAALLVGPAAVVGTPAPAAATTEPEEEALPLAVEITRLTPGSLPRRGPIRVSGTITNLDDETWSYLNLYAFRSDTPMTTVSELAEAADTPDGTYVGSRLNTSVPGDQIRGIPPGDSTPFSFTVPQEVLGDAAPGVYWFGVQALATASDGSRGLAGVSSTFLPRVERSRDPVETSVVIPLRHPIEYAADGSLADAEDWTEELTDGRLRNVLDLGVSAGDRTVAWAVDPALVDAVRQLADGNPPRFLGQTVAQPPEGGDPSASPSPSSTAPRTDPEVSELVTAAESWLGALRRALEGGDELLTLPYGDVDAAAATEHDENLLRRAFERGGLELGGWDVQGTPALVPPSGYLPAAAIAAVPDGGSVLVSDRMLPREMHQADGPPPTIVAVDGRRVVVGSSGAPYGGPGEAHRRTALSIRQRILSEAAIRHLAGEPLTVVLPSSWEPDSATGFFSYLDQPWLELTGVGGVSQGGATPLGTDELVYPEVQERRELPSDAFTVARDLMEAGTVLQNILTLNDQVAGVLAGEALASTSYSARQDPDAALRAAYGSLTWVEGALGEVRVQAPRAGVTLTSTRGSFSVDISNELDQPVTVRLTVTTPDRPLSVTVPERIELGARSTQSVLIGAETTENGIHNLELGLADLEDRPLGSSDHLVMRTAQVSRIIWFFMGGGAVVLFGAIGLRLFRRVRAATRSPASPEPEAG